MRLLPFLVAALVLAGCAESGQAPPPGPSPASMAPTPPESSAPASAVPPASDGVRHPIPGTNATYRWENGSAPAPVEGASYWMVSVTGQASDPGDFGRSCDRGFTFHLEVPARELLFDPRWHPYDPGFIEAMVVEDVDDAGGCPVAYGLHPNHDRARSALKALGDVSVDPLEDGDARVFLAHSIELRLHPGQAIRLEGRTDPHSFPDTVLVENHGAWPRSGLRAVEHDGYW